MFLTLLLEFQVGKQIQETIPEEIHTVGLRVLPTPLAFKICRWYVGKTTHSLRHSLERETLLSLCVSNVI